SAKPCAVRKRTREGSYRPTCRARLHPGARPVAVDVLRTQAVPPGPLGEILRAVSGNGAPALKDASIDCLVHRKRPPRNLLCRKRRSADRAVVPPPEGEDAIEASQETGVAVDRLCQVLIALQRQRALESQPSIGRLLEQPHQRDLGEKVVPVTPTDVAVGTDEP